jgi:hypothetical protein
MARLSPEHRDSILQLWRAGESQNALAKRFKCSPATVNGICKGVVQDNAAIVNGQVLINQQIMLKPNNEVNAIHLLVDEQTRLIKFFSDSAVRNQHIANETLESATERSMAMIESHARTTKTNKETVVGKSPDTAIQINNQTGQNLFAQAIEE